MRDGGGGPGIDRAAPEASDEELARRFVAGDPAAFDELVRRHRDRIYRFVRWHLGAPGGEAEDVTQDVLIEVFRCLPRYQGRSRLQTWMLGVAHNVCRQRRRGSSGARRAFAEAGAADEALRTVADATADLDALLARREVQARVRSAIERLGPEHRDVVPVCVSCQRRHALLAARPAGLCAASPRRRCPRASQTPSADGWPRPGRAPRGRADGRRR